MDAPAFVWRASPDRPGWMVWDLSAAARFNAIFGPLLVRVDDRVARVEMTPDATHANLHDKVHGGALLAFIDMALFAAARGLGAIGGPTAVTLDLSTQFVAPAAIGVPVEAQVELLRETRGFIFLRGLLVQDAGAVASFTATLRKMSSR